MNSETPNDAERTPTAEHPLTVLRELLSIQRDLQKLTQRLGSALAQEGHERAALLAEVETIVGQEFFTSQKVFELLPAAIEQAGPAFPNLSESNPRSLGRALADVEKIGACGGFEVVRTDSYQNKILWQLIAL